MTQTTGIEARPPTPLLERPLGVQNARAALLSLAKSLLSLGYGDTKGAAEHAGESLTSIGLRGSPNEDAWRLVITALNRALFDLLPESLVKNLPPDVGPKHLAEALLGEPGFSHLELPSDFLDNPSRLPALAQIQDALVEWLTAQGLAQSEARSVSYRLRDTFCISVDEELRQDPERYKSLPTALNGPATPAALRTKAWRSYRKAVGNSLDKWLVLRGSPDGVERGHFIPAHAEWLSGCGAGVSQIVDVWLELTRWCRSDPAQEDWLRVVAGRFNTGKTTLAKYMVSHLGDCTPCRALYVPLDPDNADWTLEQSVRAMLESSHFPPEMNVLKPGPDDPLVFVLDEWPAGSDGSRLRKLWHYLETTNLGSDVARRVILMAGYPLPPDLDNEPLKQECVFYLVPFLPSSDGQGSYTGRRDLLERDRRITWWRTCIGGAFPKVLHEPPVREITANPGMLRSIGELYCKDPGAFPDAPQALVDHLLAFKLRPLPDRESGPPQQVLMHLALALWQCADASTTDALISFLLHIGITKSAPLDLHALEKWINDNPMLVPRSTSGRALDFVSTELADYLCAKAIAATVEQLSAIDQGPQPALHQWAMRFGHARISAGIVAKLQTLIGQRDKQDLDRWHPLLMRWLEQALLDPSWACSREQGVMDADAVQRSANASETLLAMLNACARALTVNSTIRWPTPTTFRDWLACLQGQRRADMDPAFRMILSHLDFGPDTDQWDESGTDLSCLDLSGCDLSACNLNMADLHLSDLTDAYLADADMSDADLSGTRMRRTILTNATIIGARLDGIEIDSVSTNGINIDEGFRRLLPGQSSKALR